MDGLNTDARPYLKDRDSSNAAGSVTLIFYRVGKDFWKEPILNLVAAAFQMSSFTHVEIAIGESAGSFGQMCNVCRIFNDDVGVSNRFARRRSLRP